MAAHHFFGKYHDTIKRSGAFVEVSIAFQLLHFTSLHVFNFVLLYAHLMSLGRRARRFAP
jgi:hypothetical protein